MYAILGDRPMAIGREVTKKFEEIVRGPVSTVLQRFKTLKPKGEFVVIF